MKKRKNYAIYTYNFYFKLFIGEMIGSKKAQIREEEYSKDERVGSYMYYFKHRDSLHCIDATAETHYKGRLINHSFIRPNLKTRVSALKFICNSVFYNLLSKVVDFGSSFHLVLVAKRDIAEGEELLYDYGERRPEVISKNPWLLNS